MCCVCVGVCVCGGGEIIGLGLVYCYVRTCILTYTVTYIYCVDSLLFS